MFPWVVAIQTIFLNENVNNNINTIKIFIQVVILLTAWRSLPSNLDTSVDIVTCASLGFVYDTKAGLAAVTFSSVILRAERAVPTMVWICYNNNSNVVAILFI